MKFEDLVPKTVEQKLAVDGCIFLVKSGSTLYGTRTENSDDDAIGVFIEPEEYRLGRKRVETVDFKTNSNSSGKRNQKGDLDVTMHSLDKFVGLAINNNPTIVELFFAPDNCLIHVTDIGKEFLASYPLFVSKKLYHALGGYAYQQIERNELKSGNNNGRQDLIQKFGYDVKLVSHAIRLYMESVELLGTGSLIFPLKENQKLLDIKQGRWTYEQCKAETDRLKTLSDAVYASSKVRYAPDKEAIDDLQVKLYRSFYGR